MTHAFSPRNVLRCGLVLAALGAVQLGHAGYALPTPPAGLSGSAGNWSYKAANASEWLTGTARTNAALNVGGRSIAVPVGMRVAANAGTFAARFMFANPLALTAAGLAFLVAQNIQWDSDNNQWVDTGPNTSAYVSTGRYYLYNGVKYYSPATAAAAWYAAQNFYQKGEMCFARVHPTLPDRWEWEFRYRFNSSQPWQECDQYGWTAVVTVSDSSCPSGWYVTPAGCTSTPPPTNVNEETFVQRVAPQIAPNSVPDYLPPTVTPIPVEVPAINPDTQGNPQPLYIPQGEPQPVPGTDPQQYKQPMLRVQPAPTPSSPLQVDVQPFDRVTTSPQGISEPVTNPNPDADPNTQTTPSEDADLCAKNPDILACAEKPELDTPELETPESTFDLSYTAETFLGTNGTCPAPITMAINGQVATIWDWPAHCDTVQTYVRPLVLVLSAYVALMILVGVTPGMQS